MKSDQPDRLHADVSASSLSLSQIEDQTDDQQQDDDGDDQEQPASVDPVSAQSERKRTAAADDQSLGARSIALLALNILTVVLDEIAVQ